MYLNIGERCFSRTQALLRRRLDLIDCKRTYQSDGVFGYKPKTVNSYSVPDEVLQQRNHQSNFYRLVTSFRQHGHKTADINPVSFSKSARTLPELDPKRYGLSENEGVYFYGILNNGKQNGTISEALNFLNETYCKNMSAEFMHLESEEEIEWFTENFENRIQDILDNSKKVNIAKELLKSQAFDNFLAIKFPGVKRYGGEGAESMMPFFSELFKLSSKDNVEKIILAMPHRGRMNLLTGMLKFPPTKMFTKLKGNPDFPSNFEATGDVLSHCISTVDLDIENKPLNVSMLYNPSHLEAVNAVSMGKTRSKYLSSKESDYSDLSNSEFGDKFINVQVHGDAAFSGQGINQECLELSAAPNFNIGGSIHLIVNNQIGFTTPSDRGRSSRYTSDLAKVISAPIIHVNGDYPEMVLKATRIAFEYQRKFHKDVFIDMNCYRQWGHNELDDPKFTNPALYSIIRSRRTVPDKYADEMIKEGVMSEEEIKSVAEEHKNWLNAELDATNNYIPDAPCFQKQWTGFTQAQNLVTTWDTGIDESLLTFIGARSVTYPDDFNIHPHLLKTHVKNRLEKISEGINIDWATAEALAMGSLIYQGYNIRISGQDVGRGTFSHRHAMLVDQQTNNIFIPLNNLNVNQSAYLEIANSILSEEAVLGYEYGMSVDNPYNMIIWEAQFGDFFNGAQIIFDTFISSGEAKWLWSSGITILLPHGYDGAGPEHSSSRIERFLQLTDSKENTPDGDNVNMQVCQPSTPAQYFHLLRRQMVRNFRKPLIIIAPKTLLRLSAATSTFSDMLGGTTFAPIISDPQINPQNVQKIIFCSGKHYYTLLEKRQSLQLRDVALIRLESFSPFPTLELQEELSKYPYANMFIWSQEEPRNMGAWTFVKPRFENLVGRKIIYVGRDTLPTPAVGVGKWHQQQVTDVTTRPFLIQS